MQLCWERMPSLWCQMVDGTEVVIDKQAWAGTENDTEAGTEGDKL